MDYPETSRKPKGKATAEKLLKLAGMPNIAETLDDVRLDQIANQCVEEYTIDKHSRAKWEERIKEAMKLAMLVSEEKNYPFEKAANIKYPLLTTAALQFNARAYPAIVQSNRVVKCSTWGEDPRGTKQARADRVSEHMSFQLLAKMPEWEEDTDKMLVMLPIVGAVFRKVYYDPALGRNCTRLVTADRFVVNYRARSLSDVPRTTEEMTLYPYEIQERIRSGRFVEFEYGIAPPSDEGDDEVGNDPSEPHVFLEQHRLLDLDDDGYQEPYIVTVHKESKKVCRIVANYTEDTVSVDGAGKVLAIRKQDYYVAYRFLPSPDGGFYGWGFGWLLADITEAINTTLNQMLDAGHLANVQGGLVSAQMGLKEKTFRLKMGEFRVVNSSGPLNQAVMPINFPGPSAVLFNLLGLLVDAGREVASIKDVLSGEVQTNMQPTTVMALIEQGLQVFTSIYKRIHRALKAELGILARLNRENLDPEEYASFFDAEAQGPNGEPLPPPNPAEDYSEKDMDILPISDPNMVSKMQKLAKAQLIFEISKGNPAVNPMEATRRVYEAADVDDIDALLVPPPQPDPEQEMLAKLVAMLEIQEREAQIDKTRAETVETETGALKDIADASEKAMMGRAKLILDAIKAEMQAEQSSAKEEMNGPGRVPGMEGQPGNPMGPGQAMPDSQPGGAGAEGSALGLDPTVGPGMGEPASSGGL